MENVNLPEALSPNESEIMTEVCYFQEPQGVYVFATLIIGETAPYVLSSTVLPFPLSVEHYT